MQGCMKEILIASNGLERVLGGVGVGKVRGEFI